MTPRFLTLAIGWILRLGTLTEEQLAGEDDTLFGDILSSSCETFEFGSQVLNSYDPQSHSTWHCVWRANVADTTWTE